MSHRHAEKGNARPSAGAAWVERYLLPELTLRFAKPGSLRCLQLAPDDQTEADRLTEAGHACTMVDVLDGGALKFPDGSHDFAFTGRFTQLATTRESRIHLAREIHRVLRPGGALLLAVGNRVCPIDLSRNGPLLHGPRTPACLSLSEADEILLAGGFSEVAPLVVAGHFGWDSLPGVARPGGMLLDAFWRHLARPSRRWLYRSPLNPTFLLWARKE